MRTAPVNMENARSVRFDSAMSAELEQAANAVGLSMSDYIRATLRRQLAAERFETICADVAKYAAKQGILTGDDAEKVVVKSIHQCRRRR